MMKKVMPLLLVAAVLGSAVPAHAEHINANIDIGIPMGAPPAPPVQQEVMVAPPGPAEQYAWHKGHYRWIDQTYVWVPGHWVRVPHPHAVWVEPVWRQGPGGWVFAEGHWK